MYSVYIMASGRNGTLYTGIASDLLQRVYQHKNDLADGFTKRYQVHTLVYYEICDDKQSALFREKQLKKWNREWKKKLIEKNNPRWRDLYKDLVSE